MAKAKKGVGRRKKNLVLGSKKAVPFRDVVQKMLETPPKVTKKGR
jgi:hypothetical protein